MDTFNPYLVNIYIEASSKDNLVSLQALTNLVNSKAYNYQTPKQEGKKWVVWFFADIQNHIKTTEKDLENFDLTANLGDMIKGAN